MFVSQIDIHTFKYAIFRRNFDKFNQLVFPDEIEISGIGSVILFVICQHKTPRNLIRKRMFRNKIFALSAYFVITGIDDIQRRLRINFNTIAVVTLLRPNIAMRSEMIFDLVISSFV